MTLQEVIDLIQEWIVTNGNEEITADVLRPILEAMVNQPNDLIGDLDDLTTIYNTDLVGAINEINASLDGSGLVIYTGSELPEAHTFPMLLTPANFYVQLDGSTVLGMWMYNGNEWVKQVPQRTRTVLKFVSLIGTTITGKSQVQWMAEAINLNISNGAVFECEPGDIIDFYVNLLEDPNNDTPLLKRVFTRLITGETSVTSVTEFDLMPDGSEDVIIDPDLIVELGDIGSDDVWDAFNADPSQPFEMDNEMFVSAIQDSEPKLWQWIGGTGSFGSTATPAVEAEFLDLTEQPSVPITSLFKQYATTTAMIADQANQLTKQVYRVLNASDDPNITFPMGETKVYAYYEKKLAVTTGNISDYYLVSAPYMVNGGGDLNNVFFATDYGTSDADISLGSTTFGTDSLTGLQEMLDKALTRPILIYWDGKFSVSGALRIHGNTTIIALDGCGAILRNHSSTELIKNYNFADNSETDYAEIVDENISIIGGIWNHNGYNTGTNGSDLIDPYFGHPTNGSAQYRTELGADTGLLIHLISFKGVRNLRIKDAQLIGGRSFAIGLRLCEDFYFDGLRIDFGDSSSRDDYYYDGIHIFGPCRNGFINNTTLTKCKDDAISLVSDGTNPNLTFGAITNINIDNTIFFNNSYGFRFMSGANLLSNININGIIGDTKEYIFIFDKKSGTNGNTGTININDVKVAVTGQTFQPVGTCCRVLSKIDVLNITNWTRTDFSQNLSLMKFELGSAVRVFNLTNLTYYLTVSHTKDVLELTNGEIFDLNITNAEIYNTGSELNFALVGVKGSTLNRLHLKGMTTVQSVRYLVNHTSGLCTTIMSDSVRHAGVAAGASFATSGTITNLIIGTWKGAYKLYSGTITNLYGSHFNTLEVYTVSTLPSASAQIYGMIYVSDETGGAVPAFSDGTNWRRVTDRAVVS